MCEYRGGKALITNLGFRDSFDLKFRKKLRKSAAEAIIIIIVGVVGLLTLTSYYVSSLTPFSQWFLAITPLSVAFATFYLSVSIARDRRTREMATLVYTPLRKEITTWLSPQFQMSNEWERIKTEQPYWVNRMPKEILAIFKQAERLFQDQWQLRGAVTKIVSDATDELSREVLVKAGHNTNDPLASIQFYIMTGESTGNNLVYPIWLWEKGMTISEFAEDFAKKNYPRGSTWSLKTEASPRTGGGMKIAGGTEETKNWLDKIMESVAKQPDALAYRRNLEAVRKLGEQALLLIEEELA